MSSSVHGNFLFNNYKFSKKKKKHNESYVVDILYILRGQLKDVVLEGGDAFGRAHGGMKLFDHMGTDERFSKLFNQTGFTIAVVKKALEVYQGFKDVNVLVDVGGGVGNTLGVVISEYPNIKGINFDLTRALAQAPSYPGVEHVPGDMFVDVPKGDAMILKVSSSTILSSIFLEVYVYLYLVLTCEI